MLTAGQCADLRALFIAHDYTVDAVVGAIGQVGHRALGRNHTVVAVRELGDRTDPLATLIRLWPLQRPVPRALAEEALPGLTLPLIRAGVVVEDGPEVRARVDLRPYASDRGPLWVCADLTPGLDGAVAPMDPDFVLGVSSASSSLARLTIRRAVRNALDLGTGCGVQSLHLASHASSIVGTDLNPRALELAGVTCLLNEVAVDLRLGDLFAPVAEQRFDLITTNPPYVMSPPGGGRRLTYREADRIADGLVERIVRDGPSHLTDGGVLQILCNWAHPTGGSWEDRLSSWIAPTRCDAHVVQREVLDAAEYIELWLADAGLVGAPTYRQRYSEWLGYFDSLGIEAVGMGWITLHQAGRDTPDVRVEHWPYAIEEPIALALEAEIVSVDWTRRWSDEDLLGQTVVVAEHVVEERTGAPGAADPQHIVLRQQRGFRRAVEVDTALAGVVGACDGDLPLDVLVDAVARLLGSDPNDLRADVLPRLRRLLVEGFLLPTPPAESAESAGPTRSTG